MDSNIREELLQVLHPEGKEFQARIVKSGYPVLGSRVGEIRKLAKKLVKEDPKLFKKPIHSVKSYEELLLSGFILAYDKHSILEKTGLIEDYLNLVDSWALTDSFCSTFKVKTEEKEKLFKILSDYLKTDKEYFERYAQIMFLSHFLKFKRDGSKLSRPKVIELEDLKTNSFNPEETYLEEIIEVINKPYTSYMASMGAAWLVAEAFLFFPERIVQFLGDNKFDELTFNRIIKKICESNNPTRDVKNYIKKKRKE